MTSKRVLLFAAPVLAIALVVGWWAFRPELLFVDQRVSESAPISASGASTAGGTSMASPIGATKLAAGKFVGHAHETSGVATIIEVDGKRVLRLTDFMTSNGPDVHVTLIAATDAKDDATIRRVGYVSLGAMKGNIGDQNYELPADLDLSKYRAVTIWCERFSVNFGTAPLSRM
ncbi:MAG: hypothetical protein DWI48_05230 [Chloroflexi bacterium]|nr:MAG: hypothetical protein DWI48_05230 [Chloroflexota bacterium]